MRTLIIMTVAACASLSSSAKAQRPPLQVINSHNKTVIMEYAGLNQPELKQSERFAPNESRNIEVRGDDPFFVNHRLANESTVAWKVYEKWGVYLNELANRNVKYKLKLTFHQDRRDRDIQVMSATLEDAATGEDIKLFDQPGNESDFVNNVINSSWTTVRNAPDGNVDNVELDFTMFTFTSDRFRGQLRNMVVGEDDANCYIVGRWWLNNNRHGDVNFTISKQNPQVIRGYCTLDGDQRRQRYPWNSR